MGNVTIRDVAALAGVSVKTVSRVLNNEPNVRPAMQDKVNTAVAQLNFKPNPLARGLRGNKTFIVSLLYSNPNPGYIIDLQNGALQQCALQGYNLQIYPCDHNHKDIMENIKLFITNSPQDGVILTHPLCDNKEIIEFLDSSNIPYARISPFDQKSNSPHVLSDDCKAAYQMTQYLISLGHRNIAFIKGHPDFGATHKRFEGYQKAMAEAGLILNEEHIKQGLFTFESGELCAREILNQEHKPSAIFASNDSMAAGVMKVAKQLNVNVPSQLTVVGYDDAPVSKQLWPAITTIKQPIFQLGKMAMKKLINCITKQSNDDTESLFECELIIRESSSLYAE